MIGGLIILALILTGVTGMVFVSQQYDQYQQSVNRMAQYQNQAQSENLAADYPGLAIVNSTISGWSTSTSTCGTRTGTTEYNCYDMILSNSGGVGVQIARIYINSTGLAGLGCSSPIPQPATHNPQPCVLNPSPTIARYTFDQANQFINTGQTNYTVAFALPTGVALPAPTLVPYPQNSIFIVTSRGNVFSFQWPFQIQVGGQSSSAFSTAIIKIAYQPNPTLLSTTCKTNPSECFNSANEPGIPGGTGTRANGYCHYEPLQNYPAAAGYAEELTGISTTVGGGLTGNTLYFVNPWVTGNGTSTYSILTSIYKNYTEMYIYVDMVNLGKASSPWIVPTGGSLDLGFWSASHLDGVLIGVYYEGTFYSPTSALTINNGKGIPPGTTTTPGSVNTYYAIYKITYTKLNTPDIFEQPGLSSAMWWGDASVTEWGTSNAETTGYLSVTYLLSGLWIRAEC
jgi:hypothetical protein